MRFACNGCKNWWTGLTAAHCSGCHRTLTGVYAFDMHRAETGTDHGGEVPLLARRQPEADQTSLEMRPGFRISYTPLHQRQSISRECTVAAAPRGPDAESR